MLRNALISILILITAIDVAYSNECRSDRNYPLSEEARVKKDILCDYNSDYRPVKDHKKAVTVKVRLALKYLSFDPLEETLTIHSWVALSWKDEFLPWTPSDYGGVTEIILESHEIWTPRLALFNADASMYNSDSFYTTCAVENDGTVMCVPHLTHSSICRTTIKRWPYDTQNCTLYFGSWMHTGEQVNFTFYNTNAVEKDEFEPGPGWKLIDVKNARNTGTYGNSTYPMLKYSFELQREAAGPAALVVVPSIVLVILTLSSLLLDVKDNIRLMLVCFSLFGHFTFLVEIGYNIPKHSADTPIILLFLRDSMVITVVGILITLLLMSFNRRTISAPTWIVALNRLVSNGPGKYVVFTEFDPTDVKVLTDDNATSSALEDRARAADEWCQFSNLFNSICFIIIFLVYIIIIFAYIPFNE